MNCKAPTVPGAGEAALNVQPWAQHAHRLEEEEGPAHSEVEQDKCESAEEKASNAAWGGGRNGVETSVPAFNKTGACGRTQQI